MSVDDSRDTMVWGVNGRSSVRTLSNNISSLGPWGVPDDLVPPEERIEAILQRRAAELALPPQAEPEGKTIELLTFCLNEHRYGIQVKNVREIYPFQQVTPVPRTPEFVVGIFSARGRLLSIIDLHAFLGLPRLALTNNSKIIVVMDDNRAGHSRNQLELGLLVDEVEDVMTIFEEDLTPTLSGHLESQAEFTLGITADMLVVLNLGKILHNKRLIVQEEI